MKIEQAAEDFLSCRRITVTGVSHAPKGHGSNIVYQRLRDRGYAREWMHRSMDAGSVSPEAAAYGRQQGMMVIEGGCPLMFGQTSDAGHKVMCWVLKLTGSVPRTV